MKSLLISLIVIYLSLGVLMAIFLKQTPYADNPLWTMVLLWPLYVMQGL